MDNEERKQSPVGKWAKRIGVWGIIFFTVKGLLWLIVPAVFVWYGTH